MKRQDIGSFFFLIGISMAVCFDSVALSSVGCFMAGVGAGMLGEKS